MEGELVCGSAAFAAAEQPVHAITVLSIEPHIQSINEQQDGVNMHYTKDSKLQLECQSQGFQDDDQIDKV